MPQLVSVNPTIFAPYAGSSLSGAAATHRVCRDGLLRGATFCYLSGRSAIT
jgi:hypothetical protein